MGKIEIHSCPSFLDNNPKYFKVFNKEGKMSRISMDSPTYFGDDNEFYLDEDEFI